LKILVLGGAGWIGSIITRALVDSPEVLEVVIGDLAADKAKQLIAQIGSEKLSVQPVDVTNRKKLANAMKGMDAVANATWFEFCLKVTEASIDAGVNMVDLGGMYDLTLKQLELDGQAKDAGITNLIGCGETPGISNVLAKYGADKLDTVEEIHIRDGELGKSPLCWLQHSVRTSMDELTAEATIYENGKYKKVPPRSGREVYEFPDPIGEQECYYVPFEEVITLPRFLGKPVKTVDMKVTISSELVQTFDRLEDFGLTRREPIKVRGVEISPVDFIVASLTSIPMQESKDRSYSCILVDMIGTKDGDKVRLILSAMAEDYDEWGVDGEGYKTATPAAIGAKMLARGDIKTKGVMPPEACIEPEPFLTRLADKGIAINETINKVS